MPTQDDAGISISILPEERQQPFRLLELPPDLLSILTSENPPTLQLKSGEDGSEKAGGNAVLCTPDKTFQIRQKNSSNTVYILGPDSSNTAPDGSFTETGLVAISKPESTLETTPAGQSTAASYIRQLLPILASTGQTTATRHPLTKGQSLANIPFSDAECESAFRELSAFANSTNGHCMVPSAQLKIQTWLSILENARANGTDLTSELDEDAVLGLKDGLEDLEPGLFDAVLQAFTSISDGRTSLNPDRLVRWVGLNRLESDAPKTPISASSFKAAWKDALPENLRERVDFALIADRHQLSAGGKSIAFKDYALDLVPGADVPGVSESKSALGTKRKWHEKFKPTKK